MTMRTAVIPAAGLGTRFLPATKSVPKELLPIFDTPVIQLVMDEAIGAGVEHIIVVSNRSKPAIELYLTPSADVCPLDEELVVLTREWALGALAHDHARLFGAELVQRFHPTTLLS